MKFVIPTYQRADRVRTVGYLHDRCGIPFDDIILCVQDAADEAAYKRNFPECVVNLRPGCNGSCCGLGKDWNYSRGQFCEALQIAKEKGTVRWADIAGPNAEIFSKVKYIGAQGLNTVGSENRAKFDGMTLYDYMRYLWNTPKAGSSPYKLFFGVIEPCGHDEDGDIVYKYKGR